MVFDVIGGEILDRSATLVRAGGALVSVLHTSAIARYMPNSGTRRSH